MADTEMYQHREVRSFHRLLWCSVLGYNIVILSYLIMSGNKYIPDCSNMVGELLANVQKFCDFKGQESHLTLYD